ncbi:SubName: Full=Related to mitochondrial outer membrane protein IML2-Coprinopsis cinerea {ECO:0000313/EMBL:CCA68946.1} [Serendipita indica DSM 11827]|nr:SubName: Full=Related to mitochondrial outer membrane protein IML2-Coprinopsis cinerea {ECO:0000313/EMBL:CCA68946.1} [Serendipita indica DSM 11827]
MNEISEDEYNHASQGVEALLAGDLQRAIQAFQSSESPLDQLGLGASVLLQICLCFKGVNTQQGSDALKKAEEELSRRRKSAAATPKTANSASRFPPGLEWEILHAYVVVLQALFHTFSQSYYGFLQAIYEVNSAHSKFVKLQKVVFPTGIEHKMPKGHATLDVSSKAEISSPPTTPSTPTSGFFSRIIGFRSRETTAPSQSEGDEKNEQQDLDGFREEMIICGTAFGNFLPPKARFVIPGSPAMVIEAPRQEYRWRIRIQNQSQLVVVFYHGYLPRSLAWQADLAVLNSDDLEIIQRLGARYPASLLWVVSEAQIYHANDQPKKAISLVEGALSTSTNSIKLGSTFSKGNDDALGIRLVSHVPGSLSGCGYWVLRDAAIKRIVSQPLRLMIAGCYIRAGYTELAQETLKQIVASMEKKKNDGHKTDSNSIPNVFLNHWMELWEEKRARRGDDAELVDVISVNPVDELVIVWDNFYRNTSDNTQAIVCELCVWKPRIHIHDSSIAQYEGVSIKEEKEDSFEDLAESNMDLNTPDERASRWLILGTLYGTRGESETARSYLRDAMEGETVWIKTWISPLAAYELAVVDLREAEAGDTGAKEGEQETAQARKERWRQAFLRATSSLDRCATLVAGTALAGRLESKVDLTKDEIAQRRAMLGL